MKLKKLNYTIEIISITIFALGLILLINPWLDYLLSDGVKNLQYAWIFIFIITLNFLYNYINRNEGVIRRIIPALFFIVLNFYFIRITNWPIIIFCPLLIFLFILVYRFWGYKDNRRKLFVDIVIGFIFMIIHIYLKDILGFEITVFSIIGFFIFCFSLVVLFNSHYSNNINYIFSYNLLFPVIITFLILVVLISLMIGFGLTDSLYDIISHGIIKIYDIFTTVLLYIMYPVFWLSMNIQKLLYDNLPEINMPQVKEGPNPGMHQLIDSSGNRVPTYAVNTLQVLIVLFIVYYITKRLIRKKSEVKVTNADERESVFSKAEIIDDLKQIWGSFKNNFSRKKNRNYDRNSTLELIRESYYKFVVLYNNKVRYNAFYTPTDYQKEIKVDGKINDKSLEQIKQLTNLYNQARYGYIHDQEKADKAVDLIKRLEESYNKGNKD